MLFVKCMSNLGKFKKGQQYTAVRGNGTIYVSAKGEKDYTPFNTHGNKRWMSDFADFFRVARGPQLA